jgi:HEAT repeat protein
MPLIRSRDAGTALAPLPPSNALAGLHDVDEQVRWASARALGGLPDHAQALARALAAESSPRVREAMLTSLSRMGPQGLGAITPLLRSDDASLRTAALDVLRIEVVRANDVLEPLLADADSDVRILSCELARSLPSGVASALLCNLLKHEGDINVCAAAVEVLAEVGQADALPVLAESAQRFPESPFLTFAIRMASERIRTQTPPPRD